MAILFLPVENCDEIRAIDLAARFFRRHPSCRQLSIRTLWCKALRVIGARRFGYVPRLTLHCAGPKRPGDLQKASHGVLSGRSVGVVPHTELVYQFRIDDPGEAVLFKLKHG